MFKKDLFIELFFLPLRILFGVKKYPINKILEKNSFLLICAKEKIGLLLSSRILIKSLKKSFPSSKISVLIDQKYLSLLRQNNIYDLLGLSHPDEIIGTKDFLKIIRTGYDVTVIYDIGKFSIKDHLLARLAGSRGTIGISSINGKSNPFKFVLTEKISVDWDKNPDAHFSEILMQLFYPVGINELPPYSEMQFLGISENNKLALLTKYKIFSGKDIIGLHFETEPLLNRWDNDKIFTLLLKMVETKDCIFYFIVKNEDKDLAKMKSRFKENLHFLRINDYNEIIDLIACSKLFITNSEEFMHLAGITKIPLISLFGERNPFKWAPLGENKKFIKKSDFVNDINVDEVFKIAESLLNVSK